MSFNFENLPVAARNLTLGTPVAAYAYDALGRRTKHVVTGGEGSLGTRFGCATPDEAFLTQRIFAAALISHERHQAVDLATVE